MRSALPPDGLVSVAPQTLQDTTVVAREKMVVSLLQSLQATLRKFFAMVFISLVNQFKLLSTLARCVMRLTRFCATEENVHSLGRLLTAFRLWTWETTVSSHNTAEPALTPAKFGGALFLHTLDGMHSVLASRRTVTLYLTRHFHHKSTLSIRSTRVGYLEMPHRTLPWNQATAYENRGRFDKNNSRATSMDAMAEAAVWFWLPAVLMPLGLWISLSSKEAMGRALGRCLVLLGFVGVVLTPWTVPSSPSSEAGHLLGFIVGPSALLLVGLYLIAFSGNVPVGRLPKSDRRLGVGATMIGVVWFTGMHWGDFTPTLDGEVNRYWLVFWPTFLLLMTCLCSGAALCLRVIGVQRSTESNMLWFVSGFVFLLLVLGMTIDGHAVDSASFRYHLWLAGSDLLGTAVGLSISILVFGLVIYWHERGLPEPQSVKPPTDEELNFVANIVAANLGGAEDE